MKNIDALEAQFKAELVSALRRASKGRTPTLFSLRDNRANSSARKLQATAQRLLDLRGSYSVDRFAHSPAASYLMACLKWEHGFGNPKPSPQAFAMNLLRELEDHAT